MCHKFSATTSAMSFTGMDVDFLANVFFAQRAGGYDDIRPVGGIGGYGVGGDMAFLFGGDVVIG